MRSLRQAAAASNGLPEGLKSQLARLQPNYARAYLPLTWERAFVSSYPPTADKPRFTLDGPASSWFVAKDDVSVRDPISPTTKRPLWSEVRAPQPPPPTQPLKGTGAIQMLREGYPYASVVATIRGAYNPREPTRFMDLWLTVRWLCRHFAYFYPESIFGLLGHCLRELKASGQPPENSCATSKALIGLVRLLLRRQPGLHVPDEICSFALRDVARRRCSLELIGFVRAVGDTPQNLGCTVIALKLLLRVWCKAHLEDAESFVLQGYLGTPLYRQVPLAELAMDLEGAPFDGFLLQLPKLFRPEIIGDLIQLLKEKIRLDQLDEAFALRDRLLALGASDTRRCLAAEGEEFAEELLRRWSRRPVLPIHVRAFFVFPPTQAQCHRLVTRINAELRTRYRLRQPIPPDMAGALLENLNQLGYKLDTWLYTGIISMFCRLGYLQQAEGALSAMSEAGLQPLNLTATMLLWGYTGKRLVERGSDALDRLRRLGLRVNIRHLTQLIELYACDPNGLPGILKIISYMESMRLRPDVVTFQVLIDALVSFDQPFLLNSALDQMHRLGVAADMFIYTSLAIYFGRESRAAPLTYVLGRVLDLGLTLTPEYVTHMLVSAARCKLPLAHVESKLGPALASQHRRCLARMVPAYLMLLEAMLPDRSALQRATLRFLDAWAPSPSPDAYPALVPLIDGLAQLLRKRGDPSLLSLLFYTLGCRFPAHPSPTKPTAGTLAFETKAAFKWALRRMARSGFQASRLKKLGKHN
ncbi:hypothetical protein L0F63_005771 [Massospora cicadina]|nr:hypothetical protein L0F63_005771 [Massospora cicadina]